MASPHYSCIRAKVTKSRSDPEHEMPSGVLSICLLHPALRASPPFLCNAHDNRKSQSICAHYQLAGGYESDLIMLPHYYLMPWTLLGNRFVIACSHAVFIRICCDAHRDTMARCHLLLIWETTGDSVMGWRYFVLFWTQNTCGISCEYLVVNVLSKAVLLSPVCVLTVIRDLRRRMWKYECFFVWHLCFVWFVGFF